MNTVTQLIRCPNGRCEKCPEQIDLACRILNQSMESSGSDMKIVIAETERGLLHVCGHTGILQTYPPWKGDGWETVFVGLDYPIFSDLDSILDVYRVGPYLSLFTKSEQNRTMHYSIPIVKTSLEHSLVRELISSETGFGNEQDSSRERITLRLERATENVSKHILKLIPEMSEATRSALSKIIAQGRSVLGPLIPILLDDLVEEVFLDHPGSSVYFDHQKLGRCYTSFTITENEVPKVVTLIRAESNLHLDRGNPSLKMDLEILGVSLRFSVTIPPLSPDGMHLEIRRARNRPFTLRDLIENGTITPEMAAVLLLAVSCRFNITITGGPGTGKTTLLNAIDIATPWWWRKIYIEDAIESRSLDMHHQVRFRVDPVDEQSGKSDKSVEIIKSLHRSPDYLILGEIQTAEHSAALFNAISAGLRSLQTCHSDSSSSLVTRWKLGHGIQDSSLALMDLIVTLERPRPGESRRRVKEIVEIRRRKVDGLLQFAGLNVVYDVKNGHGEWAEDGAFLTYAKEFGVKSHIPALDNLVSEITDNLNQSDLGGLSEQLWLRGHPLEYARVSSSEV